MDLSFFFDGTPNAPYGAALNNYTTLTTHYSDLDTVNVRLAGLSNYTLLTTHNFDINTINAKLAGLSNKVGPLTEDDAYNWRDFVGPITDFVGDFGSELFKYWLDQSGVKDKLLDIVSDLANKATGTDEVAREDNDGDQIVDAPDLQVDFRKLRNNVFAVDRTVAKNRKSWGLTLDRDFNMLSTATFNVLDPGAIQNSETFGVTYSPVMSDAAKWEIFNASNMTIRMNHGNFSNAVRTSNVFSSNVACSNFSASNVTLSNLVVNSPDALLGTTGVARINNDGSMQAYRLNVNNNFVVAEDGSVSVNGVTVITSGGRVVSYDDDLLQGASRYKLNDVLSGNIGSVDVLDFSSNLPTYDERETTAPLNFDQIYDKIQRELTLKSVHSETMASSVSGSLSSASSRAQSVSGMSFDRVWSLAESDMSSGAWEIDINTGTVIGAPPRLASVTPEPPRVDSMSSVFGELVNAPMHFTPPRPPTQAELWGDTPAFGWANQFTADENAWSTEVDLANVNIDWSKVMNVIFGQNSGLETHLGLTSRDTHIAIQKLPDPTNVVATDLNIISLI